MIKLARFFLFAFLFCLPLLPEDFGFKSKALPDMSIIRAILIMLIFSLLLGLLADRTLATKAKRIMREYAVPIGIVALFFAWRIGCSLFSPAGAGTVLTAIRDMIYYFIPFLAALIVVRGTRDIKFMVLLLIIAACLTSFIGLFEWFSGHRLYADLTNVDSAWNTKPSIDSNEYQGVLSSFPNALAFGAFLVAPLLLASAVFYERNPVVIKLMALLAIVICLMGIIASTSRGALASLVVALAFGVFLYISRAYKRINAVQKPIAAFLIVLPIMFVVSMGVGAAAYGLVKGGNEKQFSSSMMRLVQLEKSEPIMELRPILGYGVGEAAESLGMIAATVDNYYLTVALESGFLGLLFFIFLIGYFLIRAMKAYLIYRHPYLLVMTMFLAAEITQLLVISLKQSIPLLYIGFAMLLIIQRELNWQNISFSRLAHG